MAQLNTIKKVTPSDADKLKDFSFIQCGTSGDVAVQYESGDIVVITAALVDKMALVPVGRMNRVLATGTTAADIYVW